MKEMNLIGLSQADYPATYSSALRSTLSPGLQSCRDIAPIIVAPPTNNTLNITRAIADKILELNYK